MNSPRVLERQAAFAARPNKNPGHECRVTYEYIWNQLCLKASLTAIAKKAGISVTWMCKLYEDYFAEFFGRQTARERGMEIRAERSRQSQLAKELPDLPWIKAVLQGASSHDLTVAADFSNGKLHPMKKRIRIQDAICIGHPVTHPFMHGAEPCAIIGFSRKTLHDGAVHLAPILIPERKKVVLVIPTPDIAAIFDDDPELETTRVLLRLDDIDRRRKRKTQKGRLDIPRYIDGWHYFRQPAA